MIEIKRVPKATGGDQQLKSNFVAVRNSKQGRGGDSDHKSGKSGRGSNSASTRDLKQGRSEMSDSMTNETGIDDVIFDESEVEAFRAARLAGDGLRAPGRRAGRIDHELAATVRLAVRRFLFFAVRLNVLIAKEFAVSEGTV
jgi:hypothetical protein